MGFFVLLGLKYMSRLLITVCLQYLHHSLDLISIFPLAKFKVSVKSELSMLLEIALHNVDEDVHIAGVKSLCSIVQDGVLNPCLSLIRPLILVSR